tara:strand:+ start:1411 stop:1941 length:531 start_codon:yes stop_codon:yes gene_type:complete
MKIAILGKMCSGKTTIATIIQEHDKDYNTFSFGGAVKKYAKEIFNMQGKNRSLLVNFANKMREIDPDVWVRPVIAESRLFEKCIVDDVRYQNELDALVNDNWIIVQLRISEDLQEKRIKETYPENYQDHLDNRSHICEKNEFIFKTGYPHLSIQVDEYTKDTLRELILTFLEKNVF